MDTLQKPVALAKAGALVMYFLSASTIRWIPAFAGMTATRLLQTFPKRLLASALLCLLGAAPFASAKTPGEVAVGESLHAAPMHGLNGPSKNLSDYRGKPLIINVWASWCGPCRQEMASLERLAWLNQDKHFTVIGISTDDYPDNAKALLKKTNATISHFIDRQLALENMLGASKLPLTLLVDAKGRVLEKIYGAREWDSPDSLKLISKAFRNPKIAP